MEQEFSEGKHETRSSGLLLDVEMRSVAADRMTASDPTDKDD